MKRFNHDAETKEEVLGYIKNRALQLIGFGVVFKSFQEKDFGAVIEWVYQNETYHSIFIYPNFRGKKIYENEIYKNKYKILTVPDCDIEGFLKAKQIPHVVLNRFLETHEYKAIDNYYGDEVAKRSNAFLMNHIDEGLAILNWIGADEITKKAYCLHPILQSDADLLKNYQRKDFLEFDPKALLLAMEYRFIANDYLSKREIESVDEIRLSPLKEVQQMLVADKIQNYKDFLLYHKDTHARSKELDQYFKNWLMKLNIVDLFKDYKDKLDLKIN